jgi:hypothetical protein
MRSAFLLLALPAALAVGCGSGLRAATRFHGASEPALAAADQIEEENALPLGYASLGTVDAYCTLTEGQRRIHGEWLSDVDCSVTRLVTVLRERVAAAGGELLVGRLCYSQELSPEAGARRVRVSCRAEVARPDDDTLESRPPERQRARAAGTSAAEAWRIRVDFTPARDMPRRSPRRGDLVREVGLFPAGQVRLGSVAVRCHHGCSREAVHDGVRIAAGRMGATDVAEVRCVHRGRGWACSGVATTYEVPPSLSPASW